MAAAEYAFTTTALWWYISAIGYFLAVIVVLIVFLSYLISTFKLLCVKSNEYDVSPTEHLSGIDKFYFYALLSLTLLTMLCYFSSMTIVTVLDFITPNKQEQLHLTLHTCLVSIKIACALYLIAKLSLYTVFIIRLHVIYGDTYFKYRPRLLVAFCIITMSVIVTLIVLTEFTVSANIVSTNTPISLLNEFNTYSCDVVVPDYLLICFVIFDAFISSILSYLFIKPLKVTFNASVHNKELREKVRNNPQYMHKVRKFTTEKYSSIESSIIRKVSTAASRASTFLPSSRSNESAVPPPIDPRMSTSVDSYQYDPGQHTPTQHTVHTPTESTMWSPDQYIDEEKETPTLTSRRETIVSDGTVYVSQLSHLTEENQLIKKYLILTHVAVISTIIIILTVIVSDILGFIVLDMMLQCICVAFMNKSYDKPYARVCCGAVFLFDVCEECSNLCARDHELDSILAAETQGKNVDVNYDGSDVQDQHEVASLSVEQH